MTSNKSLKFINIAAEEAHKSKILQKHGCVIVASGKLISKGFNSYRNKSKDGFLNNFCTSHAEISAIRNFYKYKKYNIKNNRNKNIKNCTIYIVRINNNGKLCSSAPCINCFNIISKMGIKKIVYSDSNGKIKSSCTKKYKINHMSYGQRYLYSI
jgi:tRNA(Arg) A34 adenosine deaminase TadA